MNDSGIILSTEEMSQYSRQIILPEFGIVGQKKLKEAKVLVIGCGGLGSSMLLYLAAAGVGTIGLVDFDDVEESNLHRQILYGWEDIGSSKVEVTKDRLQSLNPFIRIQTHPCRIDSSNISDILSNYDLVADGSDNFPTRYLVNDAAVLNGKVIVYGSVYRYEGQLSVFNYADKEGVAGPNYRDLYPEPPIHDTIANCAEAGVLGVLPGIIGNMQALEVIKVITGIGEPLNGRLFTLDARAFESSTFQIRRNPANPLNGENPSIHALIDYETFCGISQKVQKAYNEISARELYDWQINGMDIQLIDVRESFEHEESNIGGENIPLSLILSSSGKISRSKKVVIYCKSGARSLQAIQNLQDQLGYDNLYNLQGGLVAWIDERQVVGDKN